MMKKILVVDDEPDIRKYLALRLQSRGFDVLTAKCGMEALESVKQVVPDLILLDIKMPKLSGYEVLRHLRQDPATSVIPVIFVTAHADPKDEEDDVRADDFILKPFEFNELMGKIDRCFADKKSV